MVGEQKFAVFCFEAANGKPIWKREFDTGKLPRQALRRLLTEYAAEAR